MDAWCFRMFRWENITRLTPPTQPDRLGAPFLLPFFICFVFLFFLFFSICFSLSLHTCPSHLQQIQSQCRSYWRKMGPAYTNCAASWRRCCKWRLREWVTSSHVYLIHWSWNLPPTSQSSIVPLAHTMQFRRLQILQACKLQNLLLCCSTRKIKFHLAREIFKAWKPRHVRHW